MTIEQAWGVFESHAMGCDTCEGPLRQILALLGSGEGRGVIVTVLPHCCEEGQFHAEAWDHLCQLALGRQVREDGDPPLAEVSSQGPLIGSILGIRQVVGLADGWDGHQPMTEERARELIDALASLSGEAFLHVLQLPPDRRAAAIDAVILSYRRTGGVRAPEPAQGPPARRACRNCGARIKNPTHELCNDCWRAENKAQQRRGFHVIPDDE